MAKSHGLKDMIDNHGQQCKPAPGCVQLAQESDIWRPSWEWCDLEKKAAPCGAFQVGTSSKSQPPTMMIEDDLGTPTV